ncbi:PliI family lysozyme inhibitor of I-type lysozyme [Aeromonas veronii]|nr:PliI family lysozyme inhibitor of I-type lysozyme [Aeromonas veronii]
MNRALLFLLVIGTSVQAEEGFSKQLTLPSGQVIRVEQGAGEPASIGSYDVRLYSGQNAQFPLDEFQDGKVMARNGALFPKSTIKPQLPQPQVTATLGAF